MGQHCQDISVPVYCYMEQRSSEKDALSDLKLASDPLGPPLRNAKEWTDFNMPMYSMRYQCACLTKEMRDEFLKLLDSALKAKYLAQPKFHNKAPVYHEQAKDVKSPIKLVDVNPVSSLNQPEEEADQKHATKIKIEDDEAPAHNERAKAIDSPTQPTDVNPVSSLNRPVDDTVLKHATKMKREARLEKQNARKIWSWHTARPTSSQTLTPRSDDGHGKAESAETMKFNKSSDDQVSRRTNPVPLPKGLEEDTFSPLIEPSARPSNLTPAMTSMSVKRKNEEEHIGQLPPQSREEPSTPSTAPTGPKKWNYFDNNKTLPASNLGYPGRRPGPSEGHFETNHWGSWGWQRYE